MWSGDKLFIQLPPRRSAKTLVPTDVQFVSQGSDLISFSNGNTSVDTCADCVPILSCGHCHCVVTVTIVSCAVA